MTADRLEVVERIQGAGLPLDVAMALAIDFRALREELVQSAMMAEVGMREPSTLEGVGLMVLTWCRPDLLGADDDR